MSDYPYVVTRGDGSRALVAQCFTWAKYLCVMHVNFTDNGDIINYSGNPQLQDNSVPQGKLHLLAFYATPSSMVTFRRDSDGSWANAVGLIFGG